MDVRGGILHYRISGRNDLPSLVERMDHLGLRNIPFQSLLMKMNIPVEEAWESMEQLEVGGMGYLFENAAKQDANQARQKMVNLEQLLNMTMKDLNKTTG